MIHLFLSLSLFLTRRSQSTHNNLEQFVRINFVLLILPFILLLSEPIHNAWAMKMMIIISINWVWTTRNRSRSIERWYRGGRSKCVQIVVVFVDFIEWKSGSVSMSIRQQQVPWGGAIDFVYAQINTQWCAERQHKYEHKPDKHRQTLSSTCIFCIYSFRICQRQSSQRKCSCNSISFSLDRLKPIHWPILWKQK